MTLPAPEEVEVSLFGPGVGESVVVHLGWGEWIIVDSCRHRRTGSVAPLEYLEELGVDVSTSVPLVVATHAHDDHIAGIAEVFDACVRADFVHPIASKHEDFRVLLEIDKQLSDMRPRAYEEYARVFDLLLDRQAQTGRVPRQGAVEGRTLLHRPANPGRPEIRVSSVAPSDAAVAMAISEFVRRRKVDGQNPRRSSRDPNTFCAALWIEVGEARVLLGSDLLSGPGSDCGWRGVLISPTCPQNKASCFKVAHHGAPNAHLDEVWRDLLVPEPVAMLAPYRAGKVGRPSEEDCERICQFTPRAYTTGKTPIPTQPRSVQKQRVKLRSIARNVRLASGDMGQVRARRSSVNPAGDWSVDLLGHALPLCS